MLNFDTSVEIPSGVAALGNSLAIAGETSPIRNHSRTRWVLTRVFDQGPKMAIFNTRFNRGALVKEASRLAAHLQ